MKLIDWDDAITERCSCCGRIAVAVIKRWHEDPIEFNAHDLERLVCEKCLDDMAKYKNEIDWILPLDEYHAKCG